MIETDVPTQHTEYSLDELDEELSFYQPAATKTVYQNESASLISRLCDGHSCFGEIVELLPESFPDTGDGIASNVASTFNSFAEHGVIEFK